MARFARLAATVLVLCSIVSLPAQAYDQQLTTEEIREAFLLGSRNDEITVAFWNHYERIFTSRSAALHVGAVEVLTPYAQVVFAAQHHMTDENAVDAVQKYAGRTLPFIVRVTIYYPTDSLPDDYDVKTESRMVVSQTHVLKPEKTTWRAVDVLNGRPSSTPGVIVGQQFDAAQVSSAELKIRVTFKDGRPFEATFDLARLK
jgi:hypothetical protein